MHTPFDSAPLLDTPKEAYFIVDDYCDAFNREGFEVMFGDPSTAIGTAQGQFRTLRAAKASIATHVLPGETVYRVFLARRHGEHKVKRIDVFDTPIRRSQTALAAARIEWLNKEIAKGR